MKSSTTLIVLLLLQIQFNTEHGMKFSLAAPTPGKSNLENKTPTENDEDIKRFRETYALKVKSYMNSSVDPCDNFYNYACGNYPNAIEDLEVKYKRNNLFDIFFVLLDLIYQTLQTERRPDDDYYDEFQKAKQFLNSCVNAKLYPMEPQKEFLDVLNTIGGFPALDPSWNATAFEWFNMTAHLSRYGIVGLIKENLYLLHPFPPYYKLPNLGFGFDIYLENIATKNSHAYVENEKIMRDLLKVYGVTDIEAAGVVEGVFDFWKDVLAAEKIINDFGSCNKAIQANDSFREVFPKWPFLFEISWMANNLEDSPISKCPCDWYYNKLDTIAKAKPQAVANYLALKFLYTLHPHHMKSSKYQKRECLNQVKDAFPILTSYLYMKDHYKKQSEVEIFEMVSEIKDSFRYLVESANWLDQPTRKEALDKLKIVETRVGQLVLHPVDDALIKEMKNINLTNNYAYNVLQAAKFKVDSKHYFFSHADMHADTLPPDVLEAAQVNAGYYALDNSINILAGILHPPAYHPDLPLSIKYGALGYVLGHELTHGFDNMGSQIDSNCSFRDWYSEETTQLFNERSKCFIDHYNGFSVPEPELNKKIDGVQALDENIADSGGVREALAAYRKVSKTAMANKGAEDALPGLDLNSEQLFFIGFAQLYCSKYTPRDFWMQVSGRHPLDSYRVLGSLQNFEEFALVYNCPKGSPMNPEQKCRIW